MATTNLRPRKGRFKIHYQTCPQCEYENTWVKGMVDTEECLVCKGSLSEDDWGTRYESTISKTKWLRLEEERLKAAKKRWKKFKKESPPEDEADEDDPILLPKRDTTGPDLVNSPNPANDVLAQAAGWISNRAHLNKEDADKLARLVKASQDRMSVFMTVVGQHQVQRLARLLTIADSLEHELFSVERLAEASTQELTRMFSALTAAISSALSMIKALGSKDSGFSNNTLNLTLLQMTDNLQVGDGENTIELPLARRKSMRAVFDTLIHKVTVRTLNDGEEEDDPEDDD